MYQRYFHQQQDKAFYSQKTIQTKLTLLNKESILIYTNFLQKIMILSRFYCKFAPKAIIMSPVLKSKASVLMINANGIMLSVQENNNFLSNKCVFWMQDTPSYYVLNVDSF